MLSVFIETISHKHNSYALGLFIYCSFFLLQSLFAFAGNVKEDVPSTFDLYVCIGQSNMAGRATLTPEVMDTLQNVYLLNDKGDFEPAVNPLNRYSTVRKGLSMQRLGPAYGFAKEMTRKTKRPLGLVVNARGGSSINSWLKGSKDGYYEEALSRVRIAMEQGGVLKAILWHQGEADCSNPEAYKQQSPPRREKPRQCSSPAAPPTPPAAQAPNQP